MENNKQNKSWIRLSLFKFRKRLHKEKASEIVSDFAPWGGDPPPSTHNKLPSPVVRNDKGEIVGHISWTRPKSSK